MASYWEQVADAYNEGYSHSELQDHHNIMDWGDAPRPPIERAWDSSPISPSEDWLKNAPLPSATVGIGNYGEGVQGPSITDQGTDTGPMTPPSNWVQDQYGSNPWTDAGNRADQVAPDITMPQIQDTGEITGPVAPWEENRGDVLNDSSNANISNGPMNPADFKPQDI